MTLETRSIHLSELAVKWAMRLQRSDLTEAERAALQRWLLADARHADELGEASYIVNTFSAMSDEQRAEILALPEDELAEEHVAAVPAKPKPHWLGYALAASVLFATVGALWLTAISQGWLSRTYETATAETKEVRLPDGSEVHLNARTTIRWRGRWPGLRRERHAELVAGQALFHVVHDAEHPFYVQAGGGHVTVLGTKFDLNRRSDATILTVIEGAVEVRGARDRAEGGWHRVLHANQRLAYVSAGPIDDIRQVDASRVVQWREFWLDLDQEPLASVVEELSRYTDLQIVLNEGQVKTRRISGKLHVRDIRDALRDLELLAPVAIRQDGGAFVVELRDPSAVR